MVPRRLYPLICVAALVLVCCCLLAWRTYYDYPAVCADPQPAVIRSLRRDMTLVRDFLKQQRHLDPDIAQLLSRFDARRICAGTSSFTWKKQNIHICLNDSYEDSQDYPLLLFVCIHELAHVMTPECGHGRNFWENMGVLLAVAKHLHLLDTDALRARLQRPPVKFHCGKVLSADFVPPRWIYADIL